MSGQCGPHQITSVKVWVGRVGQYAEQRGNDGHRLRAGRTHCSARGWGGGRGDGGGSGSGARGGGRGVGRDGHRLRAGRERRGMWGWEWTWGTGARQEGSRREGGAGEGGCGRGRDGGGPARPVRWTGCLVRRTRRGSHRKGPATARGALGPQRGYPRDEQRAEAEG